MRNIVYYVAVTVDGYICRPNQSIDGFVVDSDAVTKYLEDLKTFDTVLMGRKTYEFGYQFGLQPGQPAYPHMQHYIFSSTLAFESTHGNVHIAPLDIDLIRKLKYGAGTDIYLCGGGDLAGWLLENEQINILKIKLNPVVLGEGIRLFGNSTKEVQLDLVNTEAFTRGVQILTYQIRYSR